MTATASPPAGAAGGRISGLDTARALAIVLAMTSHSLVHFGVWALLPEDLGILIRSATRSATPAFIILFGMMLEIAYLKMLRRGRREACWQRLLSRAIQCYLLYLSVVAAGVVGGNLAPGEGLRAAFFLSNAYFANILKFYSLGLLAGIALVELRWRFGLKAAFLVLAGIWLSYPLVKALPVPAMPELAHLASFLIGLGDETGPSVLQGMSLVALGVILGNAALGLGSGEKAWRRRALLTLAAIGVAATAAIVALFHETGLRLALVNFTGYVYRGANDPAYYLLGGGFALAMIGCCVVVAARLSGAVLRRLNVFGISSLFAYGGGNVVLNLLPSVSGNLWLGIASAFGFLACLYVATAYFQLTIKAEAAEGPDYPVAARIGRLHGSLRDLTAHLATLFVQRLPLKSPPL